MPEIRSNALHSLYGGKAARALAGNVGGQKREQTVLTPRWFLEELWRVAGFRHDVDPCTTPENPTGAERFYTEETNGLEQPWLSPGWTFVNPPFSDLEVWLRKCAEEASLGVDIFALLPFRPNRKWFCERVVGADVYSLAPFPFVGSKSAFPAPLSLVGWGMPEVDALFMPAKRGPKSMITGRWYI